MYSGAPQLQKPRPIEGDELELQKPNLSLSEENTGATSSGSSSKVEKIDLLEELNKSLKKINESGHTVSLENGVLVLQNDTSTDPVESPDGNPVTPKAPTTFEETPVYDYAKSYTDAIKEWNEMFEPKEEESKEESKEEGPKDSGNDRDSGGNFTRDKPTNSNNASTNYGEGGYYGNLSETGGGTDWGKVAQDAAGGYMAAGPVGAAFSTAWGAATGKYNIPGDKAFSNIADSTYGVYEEDASKLTESDPFGGSGFSSSGNRSSGGGRSYSGHRSSSDFGRGMSSSQHSAFRSGGGSSNRSSGGSSSRSGGSSSRSGGGSSSRSGGGSSSRSGVNSSSSSNERGL